MWLYGWLTPAHSIHRWSYFSVQMVESDMPKENGRRFNWYNRYWHDWPEVEGTVLEVARAHARYLGYEIHRGGGYGPPPGDFRDLGPVMRIKLLVFRRNGKHRQPVYEDLAVDVERHAVRQVLREDGNYSRA